MDGAAEFHAMYRELCEACERAGIPKPSPDEWVDLIADAIQARAEGPDAEDGAAKGA